MSVGRAYDLWPGLAHVASELRAGGRDPASVSIVAVTKGHPLAAVEAALHAGCVDLGENYADDLVEKAEQAEQAGWSPRWHWLGRIQTNKLARLAPHVWLWQTLDSPEHALALARRSPGARVLVQANLTGDPARSGAPIGLLGAVVSAALDAGLDVLGVMGVGPQPMASPPSPDDHRASVEAFRRLVAVADEHALAVRSIGMSADLQAAAEAGTTMVRIGEALFGPRPAAGT